MPSAGPRTVRQRGPGSSRRSSGCSYGCAAANEPPALTAGARSGTAAAVHRSQRLLAVVVVASLLGSSVAWAVALWIAPLGAYEVSLHIDDARFAIVLDRRAPADRVPRDGDPAMNDGDGLHDEYVVTVATLDECSRGDSGKSAQTCGSVILVARTLDPAHVTAPAPSAESARAGPPVPASFSILRI